MFCVRIFLFMELYNVSNFVIAALEKKAKMMT